MRQYRFKVFQFSKELGPRFGGCSWGMFREFAAFFTKQVASSIFSLVIFLGLVLAPIVPLPRYDFLLAICLGMQMYLVMSKLESKRDLLLICIFHALGLGLELYKVNSGSWSYPEQSYSKVAGVPFYSGFMYASVASYILQAWRWFDLEFCDMPTPRRTWLSVGLIYVHFFLSRVWGDWRWLVTLVLGIVFSSASVKFTCAQRRFKMPLLLSFALIGLFVWLAENFCTYLGAWVYPHQADAWSPVHAAKITSWSLMVVVAFVCVWRWKLMESARAPMSANLKVTD